MTFSQRYVECFRTRRNGDFGASWTVALFLLCAGLHGAGLNLAGLHGATLAHADDPVSVYIRGGVNQWAIQSSTGRVFAALAKSGAPGAGEIIEFNSKGKRVRNFLLSDEPQELIIKQDHLVILGNDSGSLFVIDLKSNEVVGAIAFPDSKPRGLCASTTANDFVYCFNYAAGPDNGVQINQVDLRQKSVRRQVMLGQSLIRTIQDAAISSSGQWLVCSGNGTPAQNDVALFKFDENAMTVEARRRVARQVGNVRRDPQERYWAIGSKLYSLDLKKPIRSLAGAAINLHPTQDLVAAYSNKQLNLQRITDGEWITGVAIDETIRSPGATSALVAGRVEVGFDLVNEAVFIGERTRASWIDLTGLNGKLEGRPLIKAPAEVDVDAGHQVVIDLGTANTNGVATRLKLIDGPESATLVNDQLKWRPSVADFGEHRFKIGLVSAEAEKTLDELIVDVRVQFPRQALGFFPRAIEISPDESLAVLWGPKTLPVQKPGVAKPGSSGEVIAVLDLIQNRITRSSVVPAGIRCAAVDEKYVYLAPKSGSLLYRLNHSLSEPRKVFTESPPARLIPYLGQRLFCKAAKPQVFHRDELLPIELPSESSAIVSATLFATRDRQTMIQSGRRIDRLSGEVLRYHASRYLPVIQSPTSSQHKWKIPPATRWGYSVVAGMLLDHKDHASKLIENPSLVAISNQFPLAAFVHETYSGNTGLSETEMHLRSLADGRVIARGAIRPLARKSPNDPRLGIIAPLMTVLKDTIYLISGDQLTVVKLPESFIDPLPWPACFSRKQQLEIEYGGVVKFQANVDAKTEDGQSATETELTFRTELITSGIQIDANNGEVSVATEALWASFARQSINPANASRQVVTIDPSKPSDNAKRYQALTGKQLPNGTYAAYLPISITLTDDAGRSDSTRFSVVMCGPRDVYEKYRREAIEKRDASLKLLREKQEMRRLSKQLEAETTRMQNGSAKEQPINEAKLVALERRVRRMEATLDAILAKLESIDGNETQ